jgi:DNA mismatch repair ATPase MutL
MKKIVVFLISIFTAVGLFVGCGLTPPPANSSTSEQGSSSQASVSVSSSVSVDEESSESVEESTSSEETSSESSESVEESTSSEETSSESASVEESTSSETTSETSTESSSSSSSEEEGEIYEFTFYIGENNETEYTFTWYDDNGLYAVGSVNGDPDGIIWTTTAETIAEAMQTMEIEGERNGEEFEWIVGKGPKAVTWYGPY